MLKAFLGLILFYSISLEAKECVVLMHGLARSADSFVIMQYRMYTEDYEVVSINYPSTSYTIEELSEVYVPEGINRCGDVDKIHFVTHSMGGILVRHYFKEYGVPENLGHVVMLAPPNKGSEVVDHLKDLVGYDWWNGPAGRQLGTEDTSVPNQLGPVDYSVGVIAGTKESLILSNYILGPNDGKVSVESTKVEGMSDHITFYASHTFIMNSGWVRDQTVEYLKTGAFAD